MTGHIAAELIAERANSNEPNMGLTSWKGSIVRKCDVDIAKNYLETEEVEELNRIVTMYLNYAEDQAKRRQTVTMKQWAEKLDAFLRFNDRELLNHAGKMRANVAKKLAEERYGAFDKQRKALAVQAADEADIAAIEALEKQITGERGKA